MSTKSGLETYGEGVEPGYFPQNVTDRKESAHEGRKYR
jgi:hypothetical protein